MVLTLELSIVSFEEQPMLSLTLLMRIAVLKPESGLLISLVLQLQLSDLAVFYHSDNLIGHAGWKAGYHPSFSYLNLLIQRCNGQLLGH